MKKTIIAIIISLVAVTSCSNQPKTTNATGEVPTKEATEKADSTTAENSISIDDISHFVSWDLGILTVTKEGDGYLLLTKRLSGKNRFQWPRNADEMKMITRKQYDNLMDGFSVESTIHPVPREEEDKKRAAVEKTQKKTNLFSKKACKKAEPPL